MRKPLVGERTADTARGGRHRYEAPTSRRQAYPAAAEATPGGGPAGYGAWERPGVGCSDELMRLSGSGTTAAALLALDADPHCAAARTPPRIGLNSTSPRAEGTTRGGKTRSAVTVKLTAGTEPRGRRRLQSSPPRRRPRFPGGPGSRWSRRPRGKRHLATVRARPPRTRRRKPKTGPAAETDQDAPPRYRARPPARAQAAPSAPAADRADHTVHARDHRRGVRRRPTHAEAQRLSRKTARSVAADTP
jgi:hypothetical protein